MTGSPGGLLGTSMLDEGFPEKESPLRKSLKLSLLVAVLAVCSWIGQPGQVDAAYKYCSQMTNCSPNGAWTACWSTSTGELFRCYCVNGWWDCSNP